MTTNLTTGLCNLRGNPIIQVNPGVSLVRRDLGSSRKVLPEITPSELRKIPNFGYNTKFVRKSRISIRVFGLSVRCLLKKSINLFLRQFKTVFSSKRLKTKI